jgi:hypothetical protein
MAKYIAPIDEGELAIRMAEAAMEITRPPDMTVAECLDSFPADWGEAFRRAARAAMRYWQECIKNANSMQ